MYSKIRIKLPDINRAFTSGGESYSDASWKKSNSDLIRNIKAKYGSIISHWGIVFDIPDGVIISFIATESSGKMLAPNQYKATGLMQVTPPAIWECARKWEAMTKAKLPDEAVNSLKAKVPDFFTSKNTTPNAIQSNALLKPLQNDANFNIMSGVLILRWLLERFSTSLFGGQLNKAMVAYNAGAYIKALNTDAATPNKTPVDSTELSQNKKVPAESRDYLVKMLGKDGFLSLIYIDKVI